MYRQVVLTVAAFAAMGIPMSAQMQRRAALSGGGNSDRGKCTVEVLVDGVAEVEIRGDSGTMRNISGRPPQWRRFECNAPMPANPADFRFAGVDGRGKQELIRDPRNGGAAVVRIEDRQGGGEGYTFDLMWSSAGGFRGDPNGGPRVDPSGGLRGDPNGGFRGEPSAGRPGPPPYERDRDRIGSRRFSDEDVVRTCQDAVRNQAVQRFNVRNVEFRSTSVDDNPGRRDWVVGSAVIRRRQNGPGQVYRFSCSVDFDRGVVRSARIEPMPDGNRYGQSYEPGREWASANRRAMLYCEHGVEERMRRDGYGTVEITSMDVDNRPGRNDWISGTARADRGRRPELFNFSCSVDLENGVIRSLDVTRR